MSGRWTAGGLLRELAARGEHPGVIVSVASGPVVHTCAALAGDAAGLAAGLCARAPAGCAPIVLWAPNSPQWIIVSLAVMASGHVLVPLDDLADAAQFAAAVQRTAPHLIFTTSRHLADAQAALGVSGVDIFLLDDAGTAAAPGWRALQRADATTLPDVAGEAPAALFTTSGTTGAPKAFHLTHRNIAANVEALVREGLVGPQDRALLPLPLHHAYPFVVGALVGLTLGATLILPEEASGPAILKAIRDGDATVIVGVPRLYEAMLAGIDARLAARAWPVRWAIRGLLRTARMVGHTTGLPVGRVIFAPIRWSVARHLRLLVSGGARLDPAVADRLEALGWTVLSGYGLAETAAMFTANRPGAIRRGSAGRPLGGGEIRIADADAQGIGEIELRGPSVTSGYLDNPEANRTGFTTDGWLRTGDLGTLDRDGYLFVTGRAKEVLVLGGGRKVNPEDLERVYAAAPHIREIALLEDQGALVALVRPDPASLREIGAFNQRDAVRVALGIAARNLPSYQRLSGFALTDQPLPRTRLGKFRRFLLPRLYLDARSGRTVRPSVVLGEADAALLADPTARAVWTLLQERYPAGPVGLDVNLALDLNLDSFGWMELSVALHERLGVSLSGADIVDVATVRDLLLRCIELRTATAAAVAHPAPAIAEDIDRWLAPTGFLLTALGVLLYGLNWAAMHGLFRLRVIGREHLPEQGCFVITPNHVSDLDPLAIAAALSLARLRRTYWLGDFVRLRFDNALARLFCRAVHLFPADETHPGAAVRAGTRVLDAGYAQVWFPEGWRSPDGQLQRFMPGIGQLLLRTGAVAVPVWIEGAYEALPRARHIPRLHQVSVTFGLPVDPDTLRAEGVGSSDEERVAQALHNRVSRLATRGDQSGRA